MGRAFIFTIMFQRAGQRRAPLRPRRAGRSGQNCIIGAGALVPEGMVIPDNSVAVGVPARVIKTIRDDQLAHNIENAKAYVEMGRQHAAL